MTGKTIVMYSTNWCGDCKRSKAWFDTNKIPYQEINIDKNQEALQFVQRVNQGNTSVPTIVFPDQSILVEPSNEELEEKVKESGFI